MNTNINKNKIQTKLMSLNDIKIPEMFLMSKPKLKKMYECRNNWKKYKCQDRFLVVNHNNVLIDGYIQYLILKENGIDKAEVKISEEKKECFKRKRKIKPWEEPKYKNESTTYIHGFHTRKYTNGNVSFSKDYVWRVPQSWSKNGWENDIKVGDIILVQTEKGKRAITVTKIEKLNNCPVNFKVKKVCKKLTTN